MSTPGQMALSFDTLLANYPVYTKLPPAIQNYIDELNRGLKEGQPRNTPCCLQVSHALNKCGSGHTLPARSFRRANPQLPGGSGVYYLQAVDELEHHLADTYGPGEEVKTGASKDMAAIKKNLAGRQGILLFRNGGAGAHTELWDQKTIIQSAGAPSSNGAVMNEGYIFGQPRVVFWEAVGETGDAAADAAPNWLPGWWEVRDGTDSYYYYFFPAGTVSYTKNRPAALYCPVAADVSAGEYSIDDAGRVLVEWNVADFPRESYTPGVGPAPAAMTGSCPDSPGPPFTATKFG